jgi:hypothetical protein
LPLIYVQERSGRPELVGRNHERAVSAEIGIEYIYTVRIGGSSIKLDAKYIIEGSGPWNSPELSKACREPRARCGSIVRHS